MKHIVPVVLLGAVTMLAAQALAQTQTKPPKTAATNNPAASPAAASPAAASPAAASPAAKPTFVNPAAPKPAAAKPAAAAAKTAAAHPTIVPRRPPVFVPPPPVIELDEMAVVADLPTVLENDERDRYRRIFQAQASGQFAQADGDIAQLKDKTLLGYVSAQRLLSPTYQAKFPELAQWLQDYNDHPDAPAIYKLAVARRTPGSGEITPASFVST